MKIARWFFDGISFIVYVLVSIILKGIFSITLAILSIIGLMIIGFILRALLVVRPINNMVDLVNEMEKNSLEGIE